MGYYHIKNINIDKENNRISADLADNNWHPLDWFHVNDLLDNATFEEKYANLIYNLVAGNFHPTSNNKYSRIVMNSHLENYYEDAHDIGEVETYNKYKGNINKLFSNRGNECIKIESDRSLYPEKYYALEKINFKHPSYIGDYYQNQKGDLYYFDSNGLKWCDSRYDEKDVDYGKPIHNVYEIEKFKEYNSFLNEEKELNDELEL